MVSYFQDGKHTFDVPRPHLELLGEGVRDAVPTTSNTRGQEHDGSEGVGVVSVAPLNTVGTKKPLYNQSNHTHWN